MSKRHWGIAFCILLTVICVGMFTYAWLAAPPPQLQQAMVTRTSLPAGQGLTVSVYLALPWGMDPGRVRLGPIVHDKVNLIGMSRHADSWGWGTRIYKVQIRLQTITPGSIRLPPIILYVADQELTVRQLPTITVLDPLPVDTDMSPRTAAAIAANETIPSFGQWFAWAAMLFLLLSGVALVTGKPSARPSTPPLQAAVNRLAGLDREGMSSSSFAQAVTDVVRDYFEQAWGVPARPSTNDEFLKHLAEQEPPLPPDCLARLRALLEQSDAVKFAALAAEAECLEAARSEAISLLQTFDATRSEEASHA